MTVGRGRSIERSLDVGVGGNATLLWVATDHSITLVIANSHANLCRVDVAMTPDEKGTKARLREEIKDTVEDSLGVGGDDVASLAETPGDGVQDPEEGCQGSTVQESPLYLSTVVSGLFTGLEGEYVNDVEEGDAA